MRIELEAVKEAQGGWSKEFTHVGFHWVREIGEDAEDATIIDHQGGERAYISGARTNCYHEFTQGRHEFLVISPSDTEELFARRAAAELDVKNRQHAEDELHALREESLKGVCVYCGHIEKYESLEQKSGQEGNAMRVAHIKQCPERPELKLIAYATALSEAAENALTFMEKYFGEHSARRLPHDQHVIAQLRKALGKE